MSHKGDVNPARTLGQAESAVKAEHTHEDTVNELVRLACILLRLLISWAVSSTAENLGRRLDVWSKAVVVPSEGYGNLSAVQAVLDLTEDGAKDFVKRNNLPVKNRAKNGCIAWLI
jgi:hypothetical protein